MWKLYVHKPYDNYPARAYMWVDPSGIIKHCRCITPIGYSPIGFDPDPVGLPITSVKGRRVNTKLTDEQLSKGWL